MRLEGVSAIDRYVPIHHALQEYERRINANVEHPLMEVLELPYPILVGRVEAGTWSSRVPDLLTFEGRVGVRLEENMEDARDAFERVVHNACSEAEISWSGGKFAPGETPIDHPLVDVVKNSLVCESGRNSEPCGVPYGGGHEALHQPGDTVRHGRHERHRAGACGKRACLGRGGLQSSPHSGPIARAASVRGRTFALGRV